jgi:hypothetical protein
MALLALEGVEGGLALGFQFGRLGGVLTEDESTGDEADEEGENMGNHFSIC